VTNLRIVKDDWGQLKAKNQ